MTAFVNSPLIWLLLMLTAFLTASLLVRLVPAIGRSLDGMEGHHRVSIDGLRGFLGVSVFVNHTVLTWSFLNTGLWRLPPSSPIIHTGEASVSLFFMITAFLFWHRALERQGRIDWAGFLVARVFRLYPVYLLLLALVLVASFVVATNRGVGGPLLAPLLHWLTMAGAPNLNGVDGTWRMVAGATWTLRYEWLFYLALPLHSFLALRARRPLLAAGSAVVLLLILQRLHSLSAPHAFLSFMGGIVARTMSALPPSSGPPTAMRQPSWRSPPSPPSSLCWTRHTAGRRQSAKPSSSW